jgi:hypothetical protein
MAGSHYTYIPFWKEEKKDDSWKKEAQEILKTLRICVQCNTFRKFMLTKRETFWFHISCPVCGETIKIPRKINYAANTYDKEKWK